MDIIRQLEAEQAAKIEAKRKLPEFQPGDTVRVQVRVTEGTRTRVQAYEGVVIARAGASTVAELAVAGRPAILVPLPGAIDDHQSANARALAAAGAVTIAQRELKSSVLAAHLSALLAAPATLDAIATAARGLARADAAQRLADLIDTLIAQEARA